MDTHQTNTITRRQALITIATGIVGIAGTAVLARPPKNTSTVNSIGEIQPEKSNTPSNKPFVMYF